ncbi:MAG TPA: cytochrome c oxidase subunit 3 [Bradyrhizobium sp.]|nr:cytochrome c oxidase subunit 3 [Bradyrhizobium sp.]
MSTISGLVPATQTSIRPGGLAIFGRESEATGRGAGGPASKEIVVSFGFWIFLLSDIVMFSAFFAAFQVVAGMAGEAAPRFDLSNLALQTACLLVSSFICGVAMLSARRQNLLLTEISLFFTAVLGFVFLWREIHEFVDLTANHQGPTDGAYYSAFFALVGCHGLHVTAGLLWIGTMMAQILIKGFREDVMRRLSCFSLFWHALDIVWVAIFSLVYLMRFAP